MLSIKNIGNVLKIVLNMSSNHKSKEKTHKNGDCNKYREYNSSEYEEDSDRSHGHNKKFIVRTHKENLDIISFQKCRENKCCLNFQNNIGAQGFQGVQGFQGDIGAQGFQGDIGAQGFQGDIGAQGFQGDIGAQGFQGDIGAQGFQGDIGAQGFKGDIGAQGIEGGAGAGSIIPYSSGLPIFLRDTVGSGSPPTGALVAFGDSVSDIILNGPQGVISLNGGPNILIEMAFSVPRDGVITSLSAKFIAISGGIGGATYTIQATLYRAAVNSNSFFPIPGAFVILTPSLSGPLTPGVIASGVNPNLFIPVTAQDDLLLVFSTTLTLPPGSTGTSTITGYARAGLNIQ